MAKKKPKADLASAEDAVYHGFLSRISALLDLKEASSQGLLVGQQP